MAKIMETINASFVFMKKPFHFSGFQVFLSQLILPIFSSTASYQLEF